MATASTSQSSFDPWAGIEEEALNAFDPFANRSAPGLVNSIRRALHYAKIESPSREIVIDKRAFLFGLISGGLQDTPSRSFGNTATWVAGWIEARASQDIPAVVRSSVTETDALLSAHGAGTKVVASASMGAIAKSAVNYALQTVNRPIGDLRHFVTAFLDDTNDAMAAFSTLGLAFTPEDIGALRRELYDRIAKTPERNENLTAWRGILRLDETPSPATKRPPPPRQEVSGFNSDRVEIPSAGSDPLELLAEVVAFARLICLEEVEPPLSIALFGGWGAGKSTFMQLLEHEIDALTEKARGAAKTTLPAAAAPPPKDVAAPRFIQNVVQVRFNAWHFADANLWASLTAEFFDQLRAGGYARSGQAIHTRLVERVNEHVHALTSQATNARQAVLASEVTLRNAQEQRDAAVAQVEQTPGLEMRQTIIDAVTKAFAAHKPDLLEMGRRTYPDDPVKDIEDFLDLAKRLQTAWGQVTALVRFVFARGWRAALALAGVAAVAIGLSLIWPTNSSQGAFKFDAVNVFALVAGLGALARAVMPGIKVIAGLIESTSPFATKLDGELQDEIKKVAQAEEKLRRAAAETEARREAAERAGKALARYVDPSSAVANPPRLLRFMLEDDPDARALEQEIGLISRVRRLFQAVDEIVRDERGKDPNAIVAEQRRDPDVPDRIVIYIDDLDRCTPEQVYAVLQAIHLLLAFKLFVVVVGVDVAWIQEALVRELRPRLDQSGTAAGGVKSEIDEKKLATKYLEKIFQLAFWLRPLSSEGQDGGSYARFVRALLARNVATSGQSTDGPDTSRSNDPQPPNPKPHPIAAPVDVRNGNPPGKSGPNPPEEENLAQAIATVQLTKVEIDFMAGEAIGNLAGRDPRTVKRFINVYRIIRARLTGDARKRFLGEDGAAPEFPLVAVLIAVEIGQPLEVADALFTRLSSATEQKALLRDLPDAVRSAFDAVEHVHGVEAGQSTARSWARLVRRYSFNR